MEPSSPSHNAFLRAQIDYRTLDQKQQKVVNIFTKILSVITLGLLHEKIFTWMVHRYTEDDASIAARTAERIKSTVKPAKPAFKKDANRSEKMVQFGTAEERKFKRSQLASEFQEENEKDIYTRQKPLTKRLPKYETDEPAYFDKDPNHHESVTYADVYNSLDDTNIPEKLNKEGEVISKEINTPTTDEEIHKRLSPHGENAYIIKKTDADDTFVIYYLKKGDDLNKSLLEKLNFKVLPNGYIHDLEENESHAIFGFFLLSKGLKNNVGNLPSYLDPKIPKREVNEKVKNKTFDIFPKTETRTFKKDDTAYVGLSDAKQTQDLNDNPQRLRKDSDKSYDLEKVDDEALTYEIVYNHLFDTNIPETKSNKPAIATTHTPEEILTYLAPRAENSFIIKSTDEDDTFVIHILRKNGDTNELESKKFKIIENGQIQEILEEPESIHENFNFFLKAQKTNLTLFANPKKN